MRRLLFLSPVFDASHVGGLALALDNLTAELRARGWDVERPAPASTLQPSVIPAPPLLAGLQRSALLLRLRDAVPSGLRRTVSALLWPRSAIDAATDYLRWAEARLTSLEPYDAVLVCVDGNIPGILPLALDRHPNVVVLSLETLAESLRPFLWSLLRLRGAHPYFFRSADPAKICCAVFASDAWRRQAVDAGLDPQSAHTIYYGIPVPPVPPPRPVPPGRRILWVGRLSPEKGLHFLIEALPAIREKFPHATLTAVAAQGEAPYRSLIETRIEALGLASAVTLHPPVPRADLPALYAAHDVLFFYSIFAEPVALVLMEAYANGLPVLANHAEGSDLVQDGVTCRTCNPADPSDIARAASALLDDAPLREQLAAQARDLTARKYSLTAMGDAFHRLLLRESSPASGQ